MPLTRKQRVRDARTYIANGYNDRQTEFLDFVLAKYIETGVGELDQEKLPELLVLKYHSIRDAEEKLAGVEVIRKTFIDFQRFLYVARAA